MKKVLWLIHRLSFCSTQLHFDLIIPSDGWLCRRREVSQPIEGGNSQREHSIAIKGPAAAESSRNQSTSRPSTHNAAAAGAGQLPVRPTLLTQALRAYQPDLLASSSVLPSFGWLILLFLSTHGTTAEPSACTCRFPYGESMFLVSSDAKRGLQRSAKVGTPGLVNFITAAAVAYDFCLSLPAAFTQP